MEHKPTIKEIYQRYDILPSLQLHMLRVAGCASIICPHIRGKIKSQEVISACLLHDIGNIIKFNLDVLPGLLEPEGKSHWKTVQDKFKEKFGTDEHEATLAIAREIGVSDEIYKLLENIGFRKACAASESADLERKICIYSDQRVGPHGVLSLEDRIKEGLKRFLASGRKAPDDDFKKLSACLKNIEGQIFSRCSIKPSEITDYLVNKELEKLGEFWMPLDS